MADNRERDKAPEPEMAERLVTPAERVQEQQRQAARASARREGEAHDETVPGGRYLVGDELVDAEGNPVKGRKE